MKQLFDLALFSTLALGSCGGDDEKKREDPTPDLNGIAVNSGELTCIAAGEPYTGAGRSRFTAASATGTGDPNVDLLTIGGISRINGGERYVDLFYRKPKNADDSQYKFVGARYEGMGLSTVNFSDEPVGTIQKTSAGYSGTFSVKRITSTTGRTITLEKGAFRDIK